MTAPLILVLPRAAVRAWPVAEGAEPPETYPGLPLDAALARRWACDAHAQLVAPMAPDCPAVDDRGPYGASWPRVGVSTLSRPDAAAWGLVAAGVDLDRPGHAPWPPGRPGELAARAAVTALRRALGPWPAIYATRAGARAIYPLAAPVPLPHAAWYLAAHVARVRELLVAGGVDVLGVDDGSAEWSRLYRLPRVVRDGVSLDLPADLTSTPYDWRPSTRPTVATAAPPTTPGEIPDHIPPRPDDWRAAARGPAVAPYVDLLEAGRPWGPPEVPQGQRNPALKSAVNSIAHGAARTWAPEELYAVFAPSVLAERARDAGADGLEVLWRFACHAATSAAAKVARNAAIRGALAPDLPAPPPPAEDAGPGDTVSTEQRRNGVPRLVSFGDRVGYVLLPDGQYGGPYVGTYLRATLARWHPDLQLDAEGGSPRSDAWIHHRLGTWASRVELVYPSPRGPARDPWEEGTATVRVRTFGGPSVPAERSDDVAGWLDALLSEAPVATAERALDWLATAVDLHLPTSAIYLQGPPGVGKGLLAAGVAGLWRVSPVSFSEVVGRFNDGLLRSPVVLLDEGHSAERGVSARFRSLVGESSHRIEAKGRDLVSLYGCPRVIVAANNARALAFDADEHEAEDLEAIVGRILHVPVSQNGSAYLRWLGGRAATSAWVRRPDGSPGALVRHLAWLAETRQVVPGSRFCVEGVLSTYHARIVAGSGRNWATLLAIARALAPSSPTERAGGVGVAVPAPGGDVLVNPLHLHDRWPTLLREDVARPRAQQVVAAVESLSLAPEAIPRADGAAWPIAPELVLRVAADAGLPTLARLRAVLRDGTEEGDEAPGVVRMWR